MLNKCTKIVFIQRHCCHVGVLIEKNSNEILLLGTPIWQLPPMTCWSLGNELKRFVWHLELFIQILKFITFVKSFTSLSSLRPSLTSLITSLSSYDYPLLEIVILKVNYLADGSWLWLKRWFSYQLRSFKCQRHTRRLCMLSFVLQPLRGITTEVK